METKESVSVNKEPIIFGDSIKITGEVEIRNGDTVIKAKNRFVQTILQHITNSMTLNFINASGGNSGWLGPINAPNMYLGTNTATATAYNTSALTTPIGGAPGTAPNLIIGNTSKPSNGVFQMSITATWNAGTISGTVGEMALYFNLQSAGNLFAWAWSRTSGPLSGTVILASRLSVADGSFSAFLIDNTKPLAVTWTIKVSF